MIETELPCPIASLLARRLRDEREGLALHWLERIAERVDIDPNHLFPSDQLLDHIPILIDGIADYLDDPSVHVGAEAPVMAKAMELGALRHSQGTGAYQLLKEYEILGGILFTFLGRAAEEIPAECSRRELIACSQRVYLAITVIQEATVTHYLRLMHAQVSEREARLRTFNRAVTHEMRNHIGAAHGALKMLDVAEVGERERQELLRVAERGLLSMRDVLSNLMELSDVDGDRRQQRHVVLPRAAAEAAREMRNMLAASGVSIRLGELPTVEVSAAAVELALVNYISNSIKYADPTQRERWVEVCGHIRGGSGTSPCELVVEVSDNGVGVPVEHRPRLFERGFRVDAAPDAVEGMGLGLSIVRETIEALGGRVWAHFPGEFGVSSVFALSVPCRRTGERSEA